MNNDTGNPIPEGDTPFFKNAVSVPQNAPY